MRPENNSEQFRKTLDQYDVMETSKIWINADKWSHNFRNEWRNNEETRLSDIYRC